MRRSYKRSRLTKRIESKTRKSLFLTIFGIIIFLLALVKFGIPALVNLTLFISNSNASKDTVKQDQNSFIVPPILNLLPVATNSANIEISGIGSQNQTISLYINDQLIDKKPTQKDGSFSFTPTLSQGENLVKIKSTENNKDSNFSQSQLVTFKNNPPNLKLDSPSDNQSFSKDQNKAEIKGSTDPKTRVTINGFWVIIDENNSFSYTLPLQNGENQIKAIATDEAGNTTEKDMKVTYSP